MPLFMSDAEFQIDRGNVNAMVVHADVFIRDLQQQLETHKARADAVAINAEQTCALIEQKFLALSGQFSQLESEKEQTVATLERRSTELAQAQAQIHKLEIEAIKHHSSTERLSFEVGELAKAKRELLEVVEQKNIELDEKNASIKTYLNKVVELTDERSILEGKVHEHEAEVIRSRANQTRLSQEKELVEQHNVWLNEELTAKINALFEERHESAETEAELRSKLTEAERASKEAVEGLQRTKEHAHELESKLGQTREELKYLKEDTAIKEEQFSAEVATATKLVELYKQSSDEWSNKSHELEGVIKALETHLNQVEADYKEKLEKEVQAREELAKEAAEVKERLEKTLVDVNTAAVKDRKEEDFLALADKPYTRTIEGQLALEFPGDGAFIPVVAAEVSGTALAAALLRDGWSLAKMYSKYQEAVDAWRHERQERRHSQALLERVLHEIELRAEVIMDERAAHMEMVEAYQKMEEKLQHFMEDQNVLETSCKDLKAEMRKKEREVKAQHKEIADLQTQVAVLLKECSDVQQRFGVGDQNGGAIIEYLTPVTETTAVDTVISERLLSFKDIRGMVEHNTQLRTLVRSLGQQNEQRGQELKEGFEAELKRRLEEIGRKVADTVKRSDEQSEIIDRLHGTVGMYRRLYEDEMNSRRVSQLTAGVPALAPGNSVQDLRRLFEGSQEEIGKMREEASARIKLLDEELAKARQEITGARVESARVDGEASYAREQLASLIRDTENQRKGMETVLARNMEMSQIITDYQRRLRENAQKLQASEDLSRRRSIEASVTEREKELLAAAERRASEEVSSLSERVHRLQAALDTIHTVEEARESVRAAEKKKVENELNHLQREWVEVKNELEMERAHGRNLTGQRDKAVSEALGRVEAVSKELADALKAVSTAETRAQVAEARCVELQLSLKKSDDKILVALGGSKTVVNEDGVAADVDGEIMLSLQQTKEELDRVKEDLAALKAHADQYKKIAEVSEEALKQMEEAYNGYKEETERRKQALESDVTELRKRCNDLEVEISEKDKAAGVVAEEKDQSITKAMKEIASLKESEAMKQAAIVEGEQRVGTLRQEVDKLRQQWREAQNNYERQVLLQADTIRDLTAASEKLSSLEALEGTLRERAETAEAELETLTVSWEMEKAALEAAKLDAEKKVKELDEQNQILLDRLEGMHVVAAETERKASSISVESGQTSEGRGESDLQNVIRYLRRSKETADTEVSLLKQERVRLQKQLESAYHAAEEAQTRLRREHENARASLYTDEEFRALQAQVRELNLLRDSNAELREENKKNFEDSREWREKVREAQAELEPIRKRLREKEVDLEASGRTLEAQKAETQRWEKRVAQLLEKYKAVAVDEYQRVRSELDVAHKELQELKLKLTKFEEEKETKDNRLVELEAHVTELDKKLQEALQSETTVKTQLDRFKRHAAFQKSKIDGLTKDKEEAVREIENLNKQIEEFRINAGRRVAGNQSLAAQQETMKQLEATMRQERQEAAARLEQAQKEATARQEQAQKEAAARQEQAQKEAAARLEQTQKEAVTRQEHAQKEAGTQLKERETRIQVLEKALEREREEVRKERLKRVKNEKTFYDVAQKAAQEKKRFMEELNNLKSEKDHYMKHINNAGLSVEPPVKSAELDDRASSYQEAVNQIAEVASGVTPEVGTNSTVPASATPATSAETLIPAPEVPAPPMETLQMMADSTVMVEPTFTTTTATAAVLVAAPLIAPPYVVQALPITGTPMGSTAGMSSTVPTLRPPIRPPSASSASAALRPPTRVTPTPVVTPPAATPQETARERQIMQLRAKIQEQEKAAQAAHARKNPRRLIRPRIEPSTSGDTNLEAGETSLEGAADGAETDAEVTDEAKAAGAPEVPDSTPVAPAVAASASVPVADAAIVAAPAPTAGSVARKRAAPLPESSFPEDGPAQQDSKKEDDAPPQKKSRAVEDTSMEDPYSLADLTTPAVEVELTEGTASEEAKPLFDIAAIGLDASVNERDRPVAETSEAPVLKKPRFVRPDLVTAPSQSLEDAPSSHHQDMVIEKKVPGAADIEASKQDEVSEIGPVGGNSETGNELMTVLDIPTFLEETALSVASGLIDEIAVTSLEPLASDMGLFIDIAAGNVVDEAIAQFHFASSEIESVRATVIESTTVSTIIEEETVTVVETIVEETEPQAVEEEAEEGEIVLEDVETEAAPSEPGTTAEESITEGQEGEPEEPKVKEVEEGDVHPTNPLTATGQTAERVEEGAAVTNPVEPEVVIPPPATPQAMKTETGQSTEIILNGEQPSETPEPASGHRTRLVTGTTIKPPGGRGTTINLADRAKERAALRRGGASPPSPGVRGRGRGTRGGKRGGAAGRGRLISTGVGGRGAGGDAPNMPPQLAGQQGSQPGSQGEGSQPPNTANPFEALKDDQS